MNRRQLLQAAAVGGAQALAGARIAEAETAAAVGADVAEATIAGLRDAMETGRKTAASITRQYLDRIAAIDRAGPALRSVIEVNPEAEAIAKAS